MTTNPIDTSTMQNVLTNGDGRPHGDRQTVLVVDDEVDITELYASWLADDYHVQTATSGGEALGRLTTDVDVVLLDRRMPDLTGDEVLSTIRDRGFDCRVAMVTAVEPDVDLIDMGFDDYLTKPVTAEVVRSMVRKLVDLQQHDDLLQQYFALASKIATLQASEAADELDSNPDFDRLLDRFDDVKREARTKLGTLMEQEDGDQLFRQLMTDWDDETGNHDVVRP